MQLDDLIEHTFRLQEKQRKALKSLKLITIEDLLYHFPARYGDTSVMKNISDLTPKESAVVFGKVSGFKISKSFRRKIAMAEAVVEDNSGKIKIVWFNQPYLAKMIKEGAFVRIEGQVGQRKGKSENNNLYFSNPKIEIINKLPIAVGDSLFGDASAHQQLYPVYPESRGITSNWFYHALQRILKSSIFGNMSDPVPPELLEKYHLPSLKTAFFWIHAPQKESDALAARKRFAFEEVFFIQVRKQQERERNLKLDSFEIKNSQTDIENFLSRQNFTPTNAQNNAIESILADLEKPHPMARLLEGDVGSGKTLVAATSVYAVISNRPAHQNFGNLQAAYMAPTEILSEQHFQSFIEYFRHLPVQIGLITSSGCKKFPSKVNPGKAADISRAQLLKWVANGEIPILIGTHSLIEKSVKFKHLALVIIDEQHRFGTTQRQKLTKKGGRAPHLLTMSATPIPRTLALTIFGDLDLTLLDEMPPGRKEVITKVVLPPERDNCYEKVRLELAAGRQLYVICPRIEEPDPSKETALNVKSVKEEAKRLKGSIFPEYKIAILHSKMKDAEKQKVMADFKNGITQILVATSVVEVGVNVPNATVIIIEGGERFGLSQLHQLRGRVIRSTHQAYCYIFADAKSRKTFERLEAIKKARNGFELAELDLKLRGPGELYGRIQWGLTDIAMEGIKNIKMVEAGRKEAEEIVRKDPKLEKYPNLKKHLTDAPEIHFE